MKHLRTVSKSGQFPRSKRTNIPSLAQLRREGKAANRRIQANAAIIKRVSRRTLVDWLDQAERLWIAAELHGLRGSEFVGFAADIGIIHRSTAYQLRKLHPHREGVLRHCRQTGEWPGWETALRWATETDETAPPSAKIIPLRDTDSKLVMPKPGILLPSNYGVHRYLTGNCLSILPSLDPHSVQMVVTSPPYFAQRDYGIAGQIGDEATPAEYVAALVSVFREVRRILKPDGTVWLVLGDTYAGGGRSGGDGSRGVKQESNRGSTGLRALHLPGIAKKQLLGVPWQVAFALQHDGWILRSAIVWAKPNPMCESVKDRPASAYENVFVLSPETHDESDYEHVFLLSQKPKYLYDADAIREPPTGRIDTITFGQTPDRRDITRSYPKSGDIGVNCRNVWFIPPQPYKNGHFAVMPVELASRCIKAGSRVGDTVLDPFGGVGSVGIACQNLGRSSILIELNPRYVALGEDRLRQNCPDWLQSAG